MQISGLDLYPQLLDLCIYDVYLDILKTTQNEYALHQSYEHYPRNLVLQRCISYPILHDQNQKAMNYFWHLSLSPPSHPSY